MGISVIYVTLVFILLNKGLYYFSKMSIDSNCEIKILSLINNHLKNESKRKI